MDRALGVGHQRNARNMRRDLLKQGKPLADDAFLVVQEPGKIAAWPSLASDEACSDWVGDVDKHDRDNTGFPLQCASDLSRMCEDHVGPQGDQLFCQAPAPERRLAQNEY